MNLYAFKPVEKDGVAPDGAIPTTPNGIQYRVGQCLQHPHAIMDRGLLMVGMQVLCSISIDDLDEVKQMKERIAYLEQIIRGLGYGELL